MHNAYVYIIYIYNNRKIWISLVDMYHKKTPKNSYIRFRLAVKYSQCPLIYSSREDKCGTPDSRKGFASGSGTINWTRTSLTLCCQGYASHLQRENMAVAELALRKQTRRMWEKGRHLMAKPGVWKNYFMAIVIQLLTETLKSFNGSVLSGNST